MPFKVGEIAKIVPGATIYKELHGALVKVEELPPNDSYPYYKVKIDSNFSYMPGSIFNLTEYEMEKSLEKISTPSYAELIKSECDALKALLLEKNEAYGSSIFEPVRIFSKADTEEQILTRIDDKLSRVMRGKEFQGDDTLSDLVGYLLMLKIFRKINKK
jgi:hypothetical protein